jgi:predicted DNA-binding antitoxin AbrB/MazE fold protein
LSNRLPNGEIAVSITIEAVYENGVLKPREPLPLKEQEIVRITIDQGESWAERTAGLLKWTGDPGLLEQIAEEDEFGILEST